MHRTRNVWTNYGLDQGFMQGSCVEEEGRKEGRKEGGERRAPNKAWPYEATALLIGIKLECIGQGMYGQIMDLTKGSCKVHAWRRKEGRKEGRKEEKDGPLIRLASLINWN